MKNKKMLYGAGAFALGLVLCFSAGMSVLANENGNQGDREDQKVEAHNLGSTMEVHISDNGSVLVRGAKVTAVSGTGLTAVTSWNNGTENLTWNVVANGNPSIFQRFGNTSKLSNISVGDFVSFSGKLIAGGTFTVEANIIKNWSVKPVAIRTTLEGKLVSMTGTSAPMSFMLSSGDKSYKVNVGTDTSILNTFWIRSVLSKFTVGDTVRVYGLVNTDNTVDATVVRDTNIRL